MRMRLMQMLAGWGLDYMGLISNALDFKPALEMVSLISSIKHIPAGEKVGYGITFTIGAPDDCGDCGR